MYIFLLAGHETTGNILCFALALLALYPDEQERLLRQTKSVLVDDRLPVSDLSWSGLYCLKSWQTYADLNKLTYAVAFVFSSRSPYSTNTVIGW